MILVIVFLLCGGIGAGMFMLSKRSAPQVANTPPAADREIDLGELANTTRFQEAFIIDMYNDVSASTYQKGEVYTMMTTLEDDPKQLMSVSFQDEIQDLINRGVAQQTKVAQKPSLIPKLGKMGVQLNNVFLTKKGIELAKDLLYVRSHPEIKVSRPVPSDSHDVQTHVEPSGVLLTVTDLKIASRTREPLNGKSTFAIFPSPTL